VTLFPFSGKWWRTPCRAAPSYPLVGRDEEIALLLRRWERARQGDGQLVLIVGEPGLGKSRLIEEFHARLRDTPHTWVEWSCSQLLQNTPLHPIAEWGRERFGGVDVPAEQRVADLENSLTQVKLDSAENVPLLAPLLDIPLPPERTPALAPEELRRRQLAAVTAWAIAGARVQPVVLALRNPIANLNPSVCATATGMRSLMCTSRMSPAGARRRIGSSLTSASPGLGTTHYQNDNVSGSTVCDRDPTIRDYLQKIRKRAGLLTSRHALPDISLVKVRSAPGGRQVALMPKRRIVWHYALFARRCDDCRCAACRRAP
jgi:AAA ATPase domain